MPEFVYTGGDERDFLYPRGFTVKPAEIIEADENPDPYWFEPVKKTTTAEATRPAAADPIRED